MLTLYTPQLEDLRFKEQMLGDAQTMSYNHAYGGTIPFPRERWESWYTRWVLAPEGNRFYRYVAEDNVFLGEVAYHLDEDLQIYMADVILFAPFRGKGHGKQALLMLCESAKARGIRTLYDNIAIDNPAIKLFTKCGFSEISRTAESILMKKEL